MRLRPTLYVFSFFTKVLHAFCKIERFQWSCLLRICRGPGDSVTCVFLKINFQGIRINIHFLIFRISVNISFDECFSIYISLQYNQFRNFPRNEVLCLSKVFFATCQPFFSSPFLPIKRNSYFVTKIVLTYCGKKLFQ